MPTKNAKSKAKSRPSTPKPFFRADRVTLGALVAVILWYSIMLIDRTVSRGDDFLVFYRVAQRFWDGVRPYDQVTFGNMVFKYPPWILPFFLPFSALDLTTAKFFWGVIEASSFIFIVRKIHLGFGGLPPVRPAVQTFLLLVLFGLFGSHGLTGQITLPMLAIAISVDPLRASFGRFALLVVTLSAKATSIFPLFHAVRRKRLVVNVLGTLGILVVLSLPIYFKSYGGRYGTMRDEWVSAMFSGTQDVNSVRIGFTTREVQGLPSLLLRKAGFNEQVPAHVFFTTIFSFGALALAWAWISRKRSAAIKWVGWIALMPAVQPLAWFHVFIFAYPLLAFAGEMAFQENRTDSRRERLVALAICTLLIGAVGAKTMGELGNQLELASVKLWGLIGAVGIFLMVSRKKESGAR